MKKLLILLILLLPASTFAGTFGYTTIGGNSGTPNFGACGETILSSLSHTAGSGETVTQISFYPTQTATYDVAVYTDSGSILGSRQIVSATANQWNNTNALSFAMTNGTLYHVAIDSNNNSNNLIAYDPGGSSDTSISNTPCSNSYSGAGFESKDYSVYATYTTSGGGGSTPTHATVSLTSGNFNFSSGTITM